MGVASAHPTQTVNPSHDSKSPSQASRSILRALADAGDRTGRGSTVRRFRQAQRQNRKEYLRHNANALEVGSLLGLRCPRCGVRCRSSKTASRGASFLFGRRSSTNSCICSRALRTFYWLAVETGMRAGELCGLRVNDFDLERGLVSVRQSVWRGKFQSPKSENAVRCFRSLSSFAGAYRRFIEAMEAKREGIVLRYTQRHAVGRKSARETEAVPLARFPRNRTRRLACIPSHEQHAHGSLGSAVEGSPATSRAQ